MSSETQKHPNTPPCFHAFFSSPLFVFPVPFFPASMHCVYDLMHKQVVQFRATGSHLMHGAARIAFQSRYSHNQTHHFHQQVRVTEQNWQTKIHSMQLDAGGWEASVCVCMCVCVCFFPLMTGDSYCHTVWYHVSLSLTLLSNPTFGELNERDRVCNNQPIWRSINISEAISLMWGESITVR